MTKLEEEKKVEQTNLKGVDDATTEKINTGYQKSDELVARDNATNSAADRVNNVTNKNNIVSDSVYNTINSQFQVPSAVTEADAYLSQQLKKIQSGKTSYSDKLSEMMDTIMNREKFSYDVDKDPLFQQALSSAMNSGKQAMQDTIGQASALTGGYGSTYATTAGNQAYNAYIEDAYDNLPEYYNMAMQKYQMEGDELYRQYGMLYDADATEYNRNVTAYDATFNYRNRIYDEAYGQYRDTKSDAFDLGNLQISEHNQLVSDAYTAYNVLANQSNTLYEREYGEWADSVNQALQYAQMQNSDWWNQSNQEFTASENQKSRDFQASEAEKDRAFQASENAKNRSASAKGNDGSGSYFSSENFVSEAEAKKALDKAMNSKNVKSFMAGILTEREFVRRGKSATFNGKSVSFDTYDQYVMAKIDDAYNNGRGSISESEAAYLYEREW